MEQIGTVVAAAFLAASLTGLASAWLLRLQWHQEANTRRQDRRLEAAGQVVEALARLGSDMSHSGPTVQDLAATKDRLAFHIAVLKNYGIPDQVKAAVMALEEILPILTPNPDAHLRNRFDDASASFTRLAAEHLGQP